MEVCPLEKLALKEEGEVDKYKAKKLYFYLLN